MTNYEQQLNKILNPKGCGKEFADLVTRRGVYNTDYRLCGDYCPYHKRIELCPTCKKIQQAQKETLLICAKNELEFLENLISNIFEWNGFTEERMNMCEKDSIKKIKDEISKLQNIIKKLE